MARQPKTADHRRCIYPNCDKKLKKSSKKSFRCCDAGVYCSSSCKQADQSRHKTFCQRSSTEEKLEGPKAMVDSRNACASCGKKSDALKHCARCMNISYCSKSCQQTDWSQHKTVCRSQMPHNKPESSTPAAATEDQTGKT